MGSSPGTGFATLDRLLARLSANKSELLRVLERPDIPLNTNGSENDIRCQVTRRKISGGTRSDAGRDCRDAFLGLNKNCAKLGIAFWDYLGARLAVPGCQEIPTLAEIVNAHAPDYPNRHNFCPSYAQSSTPTSAPSSKPAADPQSAPSRPSKTRSPLPPTPTSPTQGEQLQLRDGFRSPEWRPRR